MDLVVRLSEDLHVDTRAELGDSLRELMLSLDGVRSVRWVSDGTAPSTAKGGAEVVTWVAVLVALGAGTAVPTVVDALASWLRRQSHEIVVEVDGIKLSGSVTPAERAQLVDAVLARIQAGAPAP